MSATLADLVAGDAPDVVIDTGAGQYTKSDLRTAGEKLAERLSSRFERMSLLVVATSDAAMLISAALATENIGCPVMFLDPGDEPGDVGIVLSERGGEGCSVLRSDPFTWHVRAQRQPGHADALPPASILFRTSGSTGTPSAVVKPIDRVLNDGKRIAAALHDVTCGPVLSAVPVFHSYGFTHGPLAGLLAGVCTVVRPPTIRPAALDRAIVAVRARTLIGLPVQYRLIAGSGAGGFATLVQAVSAGAPLQAAAVQRILDDHSFRLHNVYGTSETGTATIVDVRETRDPSVIGHPLPEVTAEIDPYTQELLLKTDSLAVGYFGETGLRPLSLSDGWYRSGDLAERDESGIRITGRTGDVLNVGGRKTSRIRLENVLCAHPHVVEAQVVIDVDDVRGDVPVARVVPCGEVTVADLVRWSREHLLPFEVPRRIELWDELPRSSTGKLLYRDNEG